MSDNEKTLKRGKVNGYSSAVLRAKRAQRRADAEDRQAKYDRLSTADKIKSAKGNRGESKRELARLTARLAKETPPAVKTPPMTEGQKAVKAVKRAKGAAEAAKR